MAARDDADDEAGGREAKGERGTHEEKEKENEEDEKKKGEATYLETIARLGTCTN